MKTPEERAEKVAEIARVYAYRHRRHIAHTGHTVHRLLAAVSELLGRPVVIQSSMSASVKPTDENEYA